MQSATTPSYENVALRALAFACKGRPVPVRNLQKTIQEFCHRHKEDPIHFRTAGFPTLSSVVDYLEGKKCIKLNEEKTKIEQVLVEPPKPAHSKKRKSPEAVPKNDKNKKRKGKKEVEQQPQQQPVGKTTTPNVTTTQTTSSKPQTTTTTTTTTSTTTIATNPFLPNARRTRSSYEKRVVIDISDDEDHRGLPTTTNTTTTTTTTAVTQIADYECPVCRQQFQKENVDAINRHVDECLTMQLLDEEDKHSNQQQQQDPSSANAVAAAPAIDSAGAVATPRLQKHASQFLVTTIRREEVTDEKECSICLESFREHAEVVRLGCLCVYHHQCFLGWNRKSCPLHGQQ